MKKEIKISIIIILVLVLGVLVWTPWMTKERVRNKVLSNSDFIRQHGPGTGQENPEINVIWFPLGRIATTYESGWFVPFWKF